MATHDEIKIERLFDVNRFPSDWRLLFLLFYFPVGVVLCLLRIFLFFHAYIVSLVLPKSSIIRSIILRALLTPCGVVVTSEGSRDESARIIISNSITPLDRVVVNLIIPNIQLTYTEYHPSVCWLLGLTCLNQHQIVKAARAAKLKALVSESVYPVFIQPEPCPTNGRCGLLKFNSLPFETDFPVQPVLLRAARSPVGHVACSTLTSSQWLDVVWALFTPTTQYHLTILPVMRKEEGSSGDEFARAVARSMCDGVCDLRPTDYGMDDVKSLAARLEREAAAAAAGATSVSSRMGDDGAAEAGRRVDRLLHRVREVLPDVPEDVIRLDLVRTKSVNSTISRLLDGTVPYTPVERPASTHSSGSSLDTQSSLISFAESELANISTGDRDKAKPATFSSNAKERSATLTEKKEALVHEARQRYLQKHGKYWLSHA